MKLLVLLMLAALAAAAVPKYGATEQVDMDIPDELTPESYNIVVNMLIRQFIEFLRAVINNGWPLFGIPVLDPLQISEFNLKIPAGLINLDLDLKNVLAEGFGGFVVHRSNLNLRELTFDIDVSFPRIHAETERYTLVGDLFTAIPLYGDGGAVFVADNFRFQALLFLKQSDDGKSILIDRVGNAGFQFPHFKSELNGAIGGGDIDAIVNAIAEEVFFDYVNRFHGAIANGFSATVPSLLNPFLGQLDSWKFIAHLIPRS